MKNFLIFLLLFCILPVSSKESISVFPLKNNSNNNILNWIGYSFPEIIFRQASEISNIQVWDPIFIFNIDSSGWQLNSDSLLLLHQRRWRWNYCFGGSYEIKGDTIEVSLKIVKYIQNTVQTKIQKFQGDTQLIIRRFSNFLKDMQKELGIKIPSKKYFNRKDDVTKHLKTYATYATGYGYEMFGKNNFAISAYSYAIDMDESYYPALHRIGMLYNLCRNRKEAKYYLDRAVSKSPNSSIIAAEKAEFLINGSEPDKALSFIDSKRELLEKTANGMKAIGMSYIINGEYQRAVSALTRALASGQSDLEIEFMLGRAFLFLGQYSMAVEIFGRLTTYRPNHIRYYTYLGQAYRESGRLMESCNVLENAMVIEIDNVPNLINLASSYFKLGWYEKAEQFLLRAKNLNPDLGEIYINLGVLYWYMNRKKEAKNLFDQAIQDNNNKQSALSNRANILFLSGNIKPAIKAYKKADRYGNKSEIILYNIAISYRAIGKYKKAMKYFDEVLLLSPDRLDVLIIQAQLASENNLYKKAELFYRKILELSPGHRNAMKKLINLFEKQNRIKDAMQIVEFYLNDYPQDREYKLKLPDLYRKIGWYEVAIAEYLKLSRNKIYKNDYRTFLGLGKCQYDIIRVKKGSDYEQTIYNLKIAIQLNPQTPEPDYIIGLIYRNYKNYRELAIDHWEEAYKKTIDPKKRQEIRELIVEAQQ